MIPEGHLQDCRYRPPEELERERLRRIQDIAIINPKLDPKKLLLIGGIILVLFLIFKKR